jgi:MoaA/NifB/PqqE/SkfB family radical SAM enzyme
VIREGAHNFVQGKTPVEPFQGKYAAKVPDFFERLNLDERYPSEWAFKPLRVEVEITSQCNDVCSHCGMGALAIGEGVSLSHAQIDQLVTELSECRVPAIAITGGEPLLNRRSICYLISQCVEHDIEISKITTNGFWGTEGVCERVFKSFAEAGLFENSLFVPTIMLSIGEQSIPLERVATVVHHATTHYTAEQLTVAISSLKQGGGKHRIPELIATYQSMFGPFPHDRVHSTLRRYVVNRDLDNHPIPQVDAPLTVEDWMELSYDCFTPTIGTYVLSTALMKVSGDIYTCACFNVPKHLLMGNVFQDGLKAALLKANASSYVQIVARDGLAGHLASLPSHIREKKCGHYCDACGIAGRYLESVQAGATAPAPVPALAAAVVEVD